VADEIICPRCSAPNPRGTAFCGKCGTGLDEANEAAEQKDPLLGSFVGERFMVQEQLGEGGMGVVYLAEQTAIGRKVALKVLHPSLTDENLYARFRNEAAASSRLHHQNTITIYDFGKTDTGSLYIAMELIKGTSLDDEIADHGALDWRRTCKVGIQICGSLQEAHDAGIIHRDLKPDNVMLCERGGEKDVVKVLDFGIAKILEDDGQDQRKALTKTGMVFGTPQYMSPEQIRGEKVDSRSDIYSTGVIFYQMLAGVLPFTAETPMGLLTKHLMDTPPPFDQSAPSAEVPFELQQLVHKTLAKDAADRPATMKELSTGLEEILAAAGPGTGPRPTAVTASAVPVGSQTPPATQPAVPSAQAAAALPQTEVSGEPHVAPPAGPPRKGKGGLIIGIIIGAVVVFGGGGTAAWYFLWGPGSWTPPELPTQYQQANPLPLPNPNLGQQPVGPQVGQQTGPQVGQQTGPGPAPLPAIPTDTGGETSGGSTKSGGSSGGKTGGGKKPKPKDAKCAYGGSQNKVAGGILYNLKLREKQIKACKKSDGAATSIIGFSVAANGTKPEKLRTIKGGGMDSCLKPLVGARIATKEEKPHQGRATFNLDRSDGRIKSCVVRVEAKSARLPRPVPSGGSKSGTGKSKGSKSGLKISKDP
jgi:serine/threonine-protein kinase